MLTLFADTVNYHRLYAITERFVYVLDLKKECEIVRVIGGVSFGDEDLSPTLISLSRNILYVGHHVVSLTDGRVYLSKCYLQFAHKKHSFDKELMVTTCCQERTCLARFSEKT